MDINELDKKLREINSSEKDLAAQPNSKLHELFSVQSNQDHWTINYNRIMDDSEEIAIHKHDRFTEFDKHSHDYIEIMFVYSGVIKHEIMDETIELKKGEFLLLDMNVEHGVHAAQADDIGINMLIKKEFFDWYFVKQIAYSDLVSKFVVDAVYMNNKSASYIHFKTTEKNTTWQLMLQILIEYYEKRNGFNTAIRALTLLLFNELIRDYQKYFTETDVVKIDNSIVIKMMDYIRSHSKTVSLNELSDIFNYSPDYLGKLIKKRTGKSLKEIVKDLKFKQAEYLLTHTNMPVTDIIYEVGYSNASYFYKQFKDAYKLKPDEYRKQAKPDAE